MEDEDREILDNYIKDMIAGWLDTNWDFYDSNYTEEE